MKLFIDDREVTIHAIGNERHGYTSVTISDNGIPVSRHLVPSDILKSGGASYSVAIVEFPDGHIEMPRADRIRFVDDVHSPEKIEGRWEHCSPELLAAGIECINTPRRECADGP